MKSPGNMYEACNMTKIWSIRTFRIGTNNVNSPKTQSPELRQNSSIVTVVPQKQEIPSQLSGLYSLERRLPNSWVGVIDDQYFRNIIYTIVWITMRATSKMMKFG